MQEDSDNEFVFIFGRPAGNEVEGLNVYINPDEMSDLSKLNFSYEVKSFTSAEMQLQLAFENKPYISI